MMLKEKQKNSPSADQANKGKTKNIIYSYR